MRVPPVEREGVVEVEVVESPQTQVEERESKVKPAARDVIKAEQPNAVLLVQVGEVLDRQGLALLHVWRETVVMDMSCLLLR